VNRKVTMLLGGTLLVIVLVTGTLIAGVYAHSGAQLAALRGQTAYANPEQGMRALIAEHYTGIQKVEIVYAGQDLGLLDDLWFVEAHVWADGRSDGKGFAGREYDNPGNFFLRLEDGWVMVPEGRFPEVIALGKRLFGLSG